jgi:hypothetical protein
MPGEASLLAKSREGRPLIKPGAAEGVVFYHLRNGSRSIGEDVRASQSVVMDVVEGIASVVI